MIYSILHNHALHFSIIGMLGCILLVGWGLYLSKSRELRRRTELLHKRSVELDNKVNEAEAQNAEWTRAEQQIRHLIDFAHDGIVILDAETGQFVDHANPKIQEIFQLSAQDLLNGPGPLSLSPEYQPDGRRSDEAIQKVLARAVNGEAPTFEWMHINAKGEHVPCLIGLVPFPDPNRRLLRASATDLTERKKEAVARRDLETQLAEVQKLESIGQLTGGIAHDFNNLLVVIQGNAELLRNNAIPPSERESMLEDIHGAARKGAALVRMMLAFARKAELKPEVVNVNAVVAETERWMSRTIPADIKIETVQQPDLWTTRIDPSSLQAAIVNIMVNARDAMPSGGALTIETSNARIDLDKFDRSDESFPAGRYVLLSITDSGVGMPKDVLRRAFDPFFTTKEVGQGTGLGLSMVQGYVRQSGGTVCIKSQQGVGTTIELYFPACDDEPLEKADPIAGDLHLSKQDSARILVVDDQSEALSYLSRLLSLNGFTISTAESGDAALEVFTNNRNFDLLVTDISMPGKLQGPMLAKAIRKIDPKMPVIFLTGYAVDATAREKAICSDDIRLMKPVNGDDLLKAVTSALKQKQAEAAQ